MFVITDKDLRTLRKHFHTFLLVEGSDGKTPYFCYYDPRVMAVYLPSCNQEEAQAVFGPIQCDTMENKEKGGLIRFRLDKEGVQQESVQLTTLAI